MAIKKSFKYVGYMLVIINNNSKLKTPHTLISFRTQAHVFQTRNTFFIIILLGYATAQSCVMRNISKPMIEYHNMKIALTQ